MSVDLRYPIGPFAFPAGYGESDRRASIDRIATTPARLRAAVAGLDDPALDTPYRPGGWTVRQVVHHVADSHMNAYIRTRLALTEEHPTIKPYDEVRWAELPDSREPVEGSLALLDRLHARWVVVLRSMSNEDFGRTFFHPGGNVTVTLERNTATYAWHGDHHIAHITELRRREGW